MLERKIPCVLLLGTLIYLFILVQNIRFRKIKSGFVCVLLFGTLIYLFILVPNITFKMIKI